MNQTLAVITARGGSKRVPGKNIRAIAGKPLIAWTIEAARSCTNCLHSIVLSTDDQDIAHMGKEYGAEVPFLRPAHLSGDRASSLCVVQHATQFMETRDNVRFDWVLLLQPTSPLRSAADIFAALSMADHSRCDSVVGVTEIPVHPIFAKKIDHEGLLRPFDKPEPEGIRRQDVTPLAYIRNGALYLTQRDVLMEQNSIYGSRILPYLMPQARSIDIDTYIDFQIAELLLQERSNLAGPSCVE